MKTEVDLNLALASSIINNSGEPNRIMLFDLSINGHHPTYIRHLIQYWETKKLSGILNIVVSPSFIQHHRDVVELAVQFADNPVNFVAIAAVEEAQLKSRGSGINRKWRAFQEWKLVCKYAQTLNATHCLLLYFDTCQFPLILAKKPPCEVSGIYFRPAFHYHHFCTNDVSRVDPHGIAPINWLSQRFQGWWEKFILRQALNNPQLKTLFCLDPFAVKEIERFHSRVQVLALPDPVQLTTISEAQVNQLKQRLGIETYRRVFLLFGALTGRKGIYEVLAAISQLSPELNRQLCLVLAGQAKAQDQIKITTQVEQLTQLCPVQVISDPQFIPESEVPVYFQMADVVLATYQHHIGMSGILLQAAAAGKPVLSTDFGLMGKLVQDYRLGLAIDSRSPTNIAEGITKFFSEEAQQWFDPVQMRIFAVENSADRFASTLFQYIH